MKRAVDVVERHIEVSGTGVHLREAGDAPILYVHGVPTASWDWEPFVARAGGVAPDLPGFGRSDKPGSRSWCTTGVCWRWRWLSAFRSGSSAW
jgi:pimeloyl-ACP methyl ester carboxylesterase